jgi:carbamate kinase
MYAPGREHWLVGVEAVIDKDRASALLARELDADILVLATDVDGVYIGWGTPDQRRIDAATPESLAGLDLVAGSMGPKVEAAVDFVEATGCRAVIGALDDLPAILDGRGGTVIGPGGG